MKKGKRIVIALSTLLVCALSALCLIGCGGGKPVSKQFTGITFSDTTVTYDGNEHAITVGGELPSDTKVEYVNNTATNAGTYVAKVTLSKDGHETKTLSAVLRINKAVFSGITFVDKTDVWNGKEHTVTISGELPHGSDVVYANNSATDAGTYDATATVTNPNYETLVLHAKLTIKSLTDAAKGIVDALLQKPDPWVFLPSAMSEAAMAYETSPALDFTDFVAVSQIAKKPIGKQMNVLYDGLGFAEKMLSYIDSVYTVGNTIASVYQQYINQNPNDYSSFTGQAGGFKVRIELDGTKSELFVGNSTVSVELAYDPKLEARKGRIQITSGAALKYEADANSLKLAVRVGAAGVADIKMIEFVRSESGIVTGYMREFAGTENNNLKTTAVITSDALHSVIVSDKRETDDLKIDGYEEVYDSRTGMLLGGEVAETISKTEYDTLWFNLYDVSGFNSVKAVKKSKPPVLGSNADDVYVNGMTDVFGTVRNNIFGSRHFDIEMRDVWYIVKTYDTEKDKYSYEKVKTSIPMLFVQRDNVGDFTAEVKKANKSVFAVDPILPSSAPMTDSFDIMKAFYATAKEQVTRADIETYIGASDPFFSA